MSHTPTPDQREAVAELLARHLLACRRFDCPGADGMTVEMVVAAEYPVAAAAGWVPPPADLAAVHPELAAGLAAFVPAAAHTELAC